MARGRTWRSTVDAVSPRRFILHPSPHPFTPPSTPATFVCIASVPSHDGAATRSRPHAVWRGAVNQHEMWICHRYGVTCCDVTKNLSLLLKHWRQWRWSMGLWAFSSPGAGTWSCLEEEGQLRIYQCFFFVFIFFITSKELQVIVFECLMEWPRV